MHISYLALLVASVAITHSNICSANPLFAAEVAPRDTQLINPSLNLINPSPNDENAAAEPTCIDPDGLSTSSDDLGTYGSDCIAAATHLFNLPLVSQINWKWKRFEEGQAPGPGYSILPLSSAPKGCRIRLDVISDPDAEDQFALKDIAGDFRRLYTKCVRPNSRRIVLGYVPVGPRKVLKLDISPTPMGASLGEGSLVLNGTVL